MMKGAQRHAEEKDGERKETKNRGGNADGVESPEGRHCSARGGVAGAAAGLPEAQPVSNRRCL